jgi:type I restriction enzyme S subunit
MDNLNTSILGRIPVALPPRTEQETIVEHIRRATGQIERLAHAVFRHINLLREYRQALISGAVTGKVDVTKETAC